MKEPVSEIAEATKELAKTAGSAIDASKALGRFLATVLGEPIETVASILNDKLLFVRWERQHRLARRAAEFLQQSGLQGPSIPVPRKLALPIFEHGSLEDNDQLQDMWAALLASAMNPEQPRLIRSGFIDIVKQLEPIDAKVLKIIYDGCHLKFKTEFPAKYAAGSSTSYPIKAGDVRTEAAISDEDYVTCIDNLVRLGCVAFYIANDKYTVAINGQPSERIFSRSMQHEEVAITQLGMNFAEACFRDEY